MSKVVTRKRIAIALRLIVALTALGYVVSRVRIRDYVVLAESKESVPLIHLDDARATVLMGDAAKTVPLTALKSDVRGRPVIRPGLASLLRRSDKRLLLLALVLFGIQPALQVVRLKLMLLCQGIGIGWVRTLLICLVGNFYNYVIPGTTGGDIVRTGYLFALTERRHEAAVAVLMDRVSGIAGLLILTLIAAALASDRSGVISAVNIASASLLIVLLIMLIVARRVSMDRLAAAAGRVGAHFLRLWSAVRTVSLSPAMLLAAVLLTVILQAGAMCAFSIAAVGIGMERLWAEYFVCIPASLVIAAIPISPMGIGTFEAAMMVLLEGRAGSASQILALAALIRVMGLIWALPGAVVAVKPGWIRR